MYGQAPPPPGSPFGEFGEGYAPFATGFPHRPRTGFEGLPFPDGLPGFLMQSAASPFLAAQMSQLGMAPFGVGRDQNAYDTMRNFQYTMLQNQAIRQAAARDRQNFIATYRGVLNLTGQPYGAEHQQMAAAVSDHLVTASPFVATMYPDLLDQISGRRGSATVLARAVTDAGRYRYDPVTGRRGLSAESAAAATTDVYDRLYADDSLRRTHGLRAGQVGSLYEQLVMRGMAGGGPTRDEQLQRVYAEGPLGTYGFDTRKLTPAARDELAAQPAVAARLRALDADRVSRTLEEYGDAVAAIRDIFGDMGHPNAPMQELIGGLEALTSGGFGKLDPARMAQSVRQTYNLAKASGVHMQEVLQLNQHIANRAAAQGVPGATPEILNRSLAFGGALTGQLGTPSPDRLSAAGLVTLHGNLGVQAGGSDLANKLAGVVRIAREAGPYDEGSEAAAVLRAVEAGQTSYVFGGQSKSLRMADADLQRIVTGGRRDGRVDAAYYRSVVGQRLANEPYARDARVLGVVQGLQGEEFAEHVSRAGGSTLAGRFRAAGVADPTAAARDVESLLGEAVVGMSPDEWNAPDRNLVIARRVLARLGPRAGGMTEGQAAQIVGLALGEVQQGLSQGTFRGVKSLTLANANVVFNREIGLRADQNARTAEGHAALQKAMAPFSSNSMLANAFAAVQNADPNDRNALPRALAKTLGGVDGDAVAAAIEEPMRALAAKHREYEQHLEAGKSITDPAAREAHREKAQRILHEITTMTASLAKTTERYAGGGSVRGEAERTAQAMRGLEAAVLAGTGLVGGQANRDGDPTRDAMGFLPPDAAVDFVHREWASAGATRADAEAIAGGEQGLLRSGIDPKTVYRPGQTPQQYLSAIRAKLHEVEARPGFDPARRAAQVDRFERSGSYRLYQGRADAALDAARSFSASLTADRGAVDMLGPRANEMAATIDRAVRELEDIADRDGGGSLAAVLAGTRGSPEARARAATLLGLVSATADEVGQMRRGGGESWGDPKAEARKMLGPGATQEQVDQLARKLSVASKLRPADRAALEEYAKRKAAGFDLKGENAAALDAALAEVRKTDPAVTPDELVGAGEVLAAAEKARLEAHARTQVNPEQALQDFKAAYGLKPGASGHHRELVERLNKGDNARALDRLVRGRQELLEAVGGDRSKADALAAGYATAADPRAARTDEARKAEIDRLLGEYGVAPEKRARVRSLLEAERPLGLGGLKGQDDVDRALLETIGRAARGDAVEPPRMAIEGKLLISSDGVTGTLTAMGRKYASALLGG